MHVRNHLLATGRYLAVLWEWTLRFNTNGRSLKVLPVDLGIPSRPVATVKLKNRTLSPVVELFIEQAQELARSMSTRSATRAKAPSNRG
jgi:DNA-binding transcriptional LysR family regulator